MKKLQENAERLINLIGDNSTQSNVLQARRDVMTVELIQTLAYHVEVLEARIKALEVESKAREGYELAQSALEGMT